LLVLIAHMEKISWTDHVRNEEELTIYWLPTWCTDYYLFV